MMKRLVMFLVITLLSVGVIYAVSAENAKLYTTGNVLAVGLWNNATTSSDMSLIVKGTAGDMVLMDEGSPVSYIIPTADINGWTAQKFDDSSWTAGVSGIGYADADDNTVIPGPPQTCFYARYHFDAPKAKDVNEATFLFDYDDAFIVFLNGVEIGRSYNVKFAAGQLPALNVALADIVSVDHEATDIAAGKPNATRWDKPVGDAGGQLAKKVVPVDFGDVVSAVSPMSKLAITWGSMKSSK
jgi:hypothetical protein